MSKRCFKCKRELPLGEFQARSDSADGFRRECKKCRRADVAAYKRTSYGKEAEAKYGRSALGKAAAARYNRSDLGKARRARAQRSVRVRHPEKTQAYRKLRAAVASGKVKRQPCSRCGQERAEAHHPDYSKPLAVEWLCRKCHLAEHGRGLERTFKVSRENRRSPLQIVADAEDALQQAHLAGTYIDKLRDQIQELVNACSDEAIDVLTLRQKLTKSNIEQRKAAKQGEKENDGLFT